MQQFFDVYRTMRDSNRHAERAALHDALESAERRADRIREQLKQVDAPAPPSKAHLARIKRNGNGSVPAPRPYPPGNADAQRRLDFHKAMIAQLGGSRTIAAAPGCEVLPHIRHYGGCDELGHKG